MGKQIIISIGREFGSGGRTIARSLSDRFQIPLYDSNLLMKVAAERDMDISRLQKYDEIPRNRLFSRTVNGFSNSPEENIARMQFDYLCRKAEAGCSFVVLGRCAEHVLKNHPALISVFVLADMESKKKRVAEYDEISVDEAEHVILRNNKMRKHYHNFYCSGKWGDSRNYDLTVNSSRLGIEATADLIEHYVRQRIKE